CTWQDRQAVGQALAWIDPEAESATVAALPLKALVPDTDSSPSQEALPDCESTSADVSGAGCPDGQDLADDDLEADLQAKPHHPDGPEAPHWLWWNDERIRIGSGRSQRSWGLLQYFWGRDSENYEDLFGFGKPWLDSVSDSAVATAVNRFNSDMPFGFPWILATKNRCVYKKPRQNPAA